MKYYICPDCKARTPVAKWRNIEYDCEMYGDHEGVECPNCLLWCGDYLDSGWPEKDED